MNHISIAEINLVQQNRRYLSHQPKISWKQILANPNIVKLSIAAFCSQWALYFFVAWMPVYLQQGRHFSETNMKFTVSLIFIVGIVGSLISGIIGDWLVKQKSLTFTRRFFPMTPLG